MSTDLPRHTIIETADVTDALDEAAQRWRDASPAQLIKHVLLDWAFGDGSEDAKRRAANRLKMVGRWPGTSGVYNRADDWPA